MSRLAGSLPSPYMHLLKHQQSFIDRNPDKALLVWEGGTGKTVGAAAWLRLGRDTNALVICPKKVVRKWEKELEKWGAKALVISKEKAKKMPLSPWTAIVVDEADEFASPLFVAKSRSQLSEWLYSQVKGYPDIPMLLLTATPVRSSPWNLHTLLCYVSHYIDWKAYRDAFFSLVKLPYMQRPGYVPKPSWRADIRALLVRYADIVLLKDCVGELPPITDTVVEVHCPDFVRTIDSKPFFDEHRWEQQNKAEHIRDIGREYRKVLVVAYYREQIAELESALSKDRQTFAIHGGVSDQEAVIQAATDSDECYFIVQASIGAGFDADTFSCIVFASMSYSVRDFVQMNFRVRRIHNLHPVARYYLMAGRCDRAVLANVEKGFDFVPSMWEND